MNDSRFGLTASVWTKNAARARWFAERLEAGTIYPLEGPGLGVTLNEDVLAGYRLT